MSNSWPKLDYNKYKDTAALVHLWTQIVGKIRLRKMPWLNHSWHVSLYVTPTGFTTGSIPYKNGMFEIEFNFIYHLLSIRTSEGKNAKMPLESAPISSFYKQINGHLKSLGIDVTIHAAPNEVDPSIPFAEDHAPRIYDSKEMQNLWQAFISVHNVFVKFRSKFIGKCSPVHLFWGAFDLAVTRFTGKTAPEHPGGMPNMPLRVMQEAYSHEVSSAGFWPGSEQSPQPVFYSYSYPTPADFGKQIVQPSEAFYSEEMGEFFLPYDAVASSNNPNETLMSFLQSTYEAAANTGNWDRKALEFDFSSFELVH
ncbi:MAG: hypothetical protein HKO56_08355 [Bacteroidia bacterium]|nr:hypothetical protein [Bacteroidia bacterium]NNC85047.1 hypothetical protein [Bacteroidia bacterium]NNM16655.1 hypothetical protein [Bacteroidia bacterium]